MSSPQDPNQPGQPGQGWDQPPQPNQTGSGAPPPPPQPNQPGWGAPPPPPQPNQPGWGAPPPGAPQGWGAPPPGYPQQPGWGAPAYQARSNRHGCLIAFLIVLLGLVLVGGCTVFVAGPYITTTIKLYQDVGTDRMSSLNFETVNGQLTWVIHLKAGFESEATDIACHVVWPDLNGAAFEIVDDLGHVLATDMTPCP